MKHFILSIILLHSSICQAFQTHKERAHQAFEDGFQRAQIWFEQLKTSSLPVQLTFINAIAEKQDAAYANLQKILKNRKFYIKNYPAPSDPDNFITPVVNIPLQERCERIIRKCETTGLITTLLPRSCVIIKDDKFKAYRNSKQNVICIPETTASLMSDEELLGPISHELGHTVPNIFLKTPEKDILTLDHIALTCLHHSNYEHIHPKIKTAAICITQLNEFYADMHAVFCGEKATKSLIQSLVKSYSKYNIEEPEHYVTHPNFSDRIKEMSALLHTTIWYNETPPTEWVLSQSHY